MNVTTEEFDDSLVAVIADDLFALLPREGAGKLMSIPGVYEILSEYYNNAAITHAEECKA